MKTGMLTNIQKILKDLIQSSFLCKESVKTTIYIAGREHKSMKERVVAKLNELAGLGQSNPSGMTASGGCLSLKTPE